MSINTHVTCQSTHIQPVNQQTHDLSINTHVTYQTTHIQPVDTHVNQHTHVTCELTHITILSINDLKKSLLTFCKRESRRKGSCNDCSQFPWECMRLSRRQTSFHLLPVSEPASPVGKLAIVNRQIAAEKSPLQTQTSHSEFLTTSTFHNVKDYYS